MFHFHYYCGVHEIKNFVIHQWASETLSMIILHILTISSKNYISFACTHTVPLLLASYDDDMMIIWCLIMMLELFLENHASFVYISLTFGTCYNTKCVDMVLLVLQNIPTRFSTFPSLQMNRRHYESYICKRVPGKQAVVVMACDNRHMNDDMLLDPGLVMIFAHGIEWRASGASVQLFANVRWSIRPCLRKSVACEGLKSSEISCAVSVLCVCVLCVSAWLFAEFKREVLLPSNLEIWMEFMHLLSCRKKYSVLYFLSIWLSFLYYFKSKTLHTNSFGKQNHHKKLHS